MSNENIQIRTGPIYQIVLTTRGGGIERFITIKFDEMINSVKATGFYGRASSVEEAKKLIDDGNTDKFIEMTFPWHRIHSIQNLIYRHKGNK